MAKSKELMQQNLGVAVAGMPEIPVFNAPLVTKQLMDFSSQATRVFEGAERAVIDSPQSAAVGADFLKAIGTRIKEVDEARKAVTGKFDSLVKSLNTLFTKGPTAQLELAKALMQTKLGTYARAEREKAEADARAERERIAAEAAAAATKAVEEGDSAGALEILQGAAAIEVEAAPVQVRGRSAVLSGTRRKVGKITDMRKFLLWVANNQTAPSLAVLAGISVGQRELNQLASTALLVRETSGELFLTPGFEASYEETFGAR